MMTAFEAEKFTPAPRTTPDDASGNTRSLNRALDRKLYLVVKAPGTATWTLPQTQHVTDEPLRKVRVVIRCNLVMQRWAQTAERALSGAGSPVHAYFLSNAPSGVLVRA